MSRRRRSTNAAFSLFSFQDIISSVMGVIVFIVLMIAIELATRSLESPTSQRKAVQQDLSEQIQQVSAAIDKLKEILAQNDAGAVVPLTKNEIENELRALEEVTATLASQKAAAEERAKKLQDAAEAEQFRAENSSPMKEIQKRREELAALENELKKIKLSKNLMFRKQPGETKLAWIVEISSDLLLCAPAGRTQPPRRFNGVSSESDFLRWASTLDRSSNYFVLMSKPGGVGSLHVIEEALRRRGYSVGLDLLGAEQGAVDPESGVPTVDEEEE